MNMTHDEAAKAAEVLVQAYRQGRLTPDVAGPKQVLGMVDLLERTAGAFRDRDSDLAAIHENAARVNADKKWWDVKLEDMTRDELVTTIGELAALVTHYRKEKNVDALVIRQLQGQVAEWSGSGSQYDNLRGAKR